MAFVLSIIKLEEALKKSGCPICRMEHDAAIRAVDSLLWENVTDPQTRRDVDQAKGFCPEHTRMLVARELSRSGPLLGVNIIYQSLAKKLSVNLGQLKQKKNTRQGLRAWLGKLGIILSQPKREIFSKHNHRCPVCVTVDQAGQNSLSTLFETLQGKDDLVKTAYLASSGICLSHLQSGLAAYSDQFPIAADFLLEHTINHLDQQQLHMLEYIRKQSWANREEKLSDAEKIAWLKTVIFFTGQPADKFNHHIDEF